MAGINNNNNLGEGLHTVVENVTPLKTIRKTVVLTTKELGNIINTLMKGTFSDYKGTSFRLQAGVVVPILWFDTTQNYDCKGTVKAMVQSNSKQQNQNQTSSQKWGNTFRRTNNQLKGNFQPFELSKEAKEILSNYNTFGYNWNNMVGFRDQTPRQGYISGTGVKETCLKVTGLDVQAILKEIYGETQSVDFDTKEHPMDYRLTFKQYIDPEMARTGYNGMMPIVENDADGDRRTMLLELTMTDMYVTNELSSLIGLYPVNDNPPII